MIYYLVYPALSLCVWAIFGFLTGGFIFAYLTEIAFLWIYGLILFNRVCSKAIVVGRVDTDSLRRVVMHSCMLVFVFMVLSGFSLFSGIDIFVFSGLKNSLIVLGVFFMINLISFFIIKKMINI